MQTFVSETYFVKNLKSYNDEHNIRTDHVSVVLSESPGGGLEMYYCSKCRFPILQYEGLQVKELPGLVPVRLPKIIQCRGRNCGRKYQFVSILKRVVL